MARWGAIRSERSRSRPEGGAVASPRVLVLEDDPRLMALLTAVLEDGGYAVSPSDSGLEAMERARTLRSEAIVLGLGPSYQSNATLLAALKVDPGTAPIPVVIVSGHPEILMAERRALAAAILSKPFSPRALLDAVHVARQGASRGRPGRRRHGLPDDAAGPVCNHTRLGRRLNAEAGRGEDAA